MRLVEPWIKVENFDGVKIMKRIERACRTCYRSEDKISEEIFSLVARIWGVSYEIWYSSIKKKNAC